MFISLNLWWFSVTAGNLKREKKRENGAKWQIYCCFLFQNFSTLFLFSLVFLCVQLCSGIKDFVESKVTLLMLFLNAKKWAYVYVYIYCLRSWNILSPSNKGPSFLGYYSVAIWGNTSSISDTGTKFLSILRRYISWPFSFPYFLCLD